MWNRQSEPLDADTILGAYETRYGPEATDRERRTLALHGDRRLAFLDAALTSASWRMVPEGS